MKPELAHLFEEYAAAHRHPMNRLTHKLAIPLIVFQSLAMLDWIELGQAGSLHVTAAHLGYVAVMAYYLRLHVRLAIVMALLWALCFPIAALTPVPVVIAIGIIGWTVQLLGHIRYEKNRPAFATNLLHALVGPLFFVAVVMGVWPPRRETVGNS